MKIEKGIPIPALYHGVVPLARTMEVGDSMFLPKKHSCSNIINALKDKKFVVRKVEDGWRVWRIS